MHRIDHATAAPGNLFTEGNPATATPATTVTDDWLNDVQGNICDVVETAGLALVKGDYTQLRQAIQAMLIASQKAVIINNATFEASVSNGEVVRWDSGNSRFDEAIADGTENNRAVGIADVTNSKVYLYGECPLFSGLTPGARYYLGGSTAGAITTTAPTDAVMVGIAKSATVLWVDIDSSGAAQDAYPFGALPFPTIATPTNRLTVTPAAVAGQGGTVSIPSGVYVSVCEAVNASTGRKRSYQTPAFTSGNLAVSSTYFLRCKVIAGVLTFYTQKGTDTDATPGTLVGTVDGASGGGFDSTCLDMLVAKVVTGTAGTTPTVTALANAEYLYARSAEMTVSAVAGPNTAGTLSTATGAESWVNLRFETLNWGRKPKFGLAQTGQMSFVSYEMNYLMLPQTYNRYRVLGTYSGSPSFTPGDGVYTNLEAFA